MLPEASSVCQIERQARSVGGDVEALQGVYGAVHQAGDSFPWNPLPRPSGHNRKDIQELSAGWNAITTGIKGLYMFALKRPKHDHL